MGPSSFSSGQRITFQDYLCVLRALKMPVALWHTGLLLCVLSFCSCFGEECVLGIVGQPVSLPCVYPEILNFGDFSIEWRRGDEVVLRSVWVENENKEELSANSAAISSDAARTGNFSLELPTVDAKEHNMNYSLSVTVGENQSDALCTVCLRIAARFTPPQLEREEDAQKDETVFLCHSTGGFPEPVVYWLINNTVEPPKGSVRTTAAPLPDSHLYNITSHLKVNISTDSVVSCTIQNPSMNETVTSTSYGAPSSQVVSRASEAMWIFSTGLCAVVGVLVAVGVAYQIHLDRISKRKKREFQYMKRGNKSRDLCREETEAMKSVAKETDV